MDNDNKNLTINKIVIDEKTAEPKIVEVSAKEQAKQDKLIGKSEINAQKPEKTTKDKSSKQLSMNQFVDLDYSKNSVNSRQKMFKTIFTVVFAVFFVAIFVWTFYNDFFASEKPRASFSEILGIISKNWYFLIFALLSIFFVFFFKGLKLSILCRKMTGKWHFKTCQETGIVGLYYNNITPLAVGGQPFEIYHLSKHGVHGGVASSLPIISFFLNQLAFVILGFLALILYKGNLLNIPQNMFSAFAYDITTMLAIIGLICCLLMPSLVIMFSLMPRFCSKVVHYVMVLGNKLKIVKNPKLTTMKTMKTVFHNSKCIKKVSKSPLVFSSIFLLSFGEQLANSSIAYFTLKFFGFDWQSLTGIYEWLAVVQLCLILNAAVSFIPTPGNSGAADLSFYLLFEKGLTAGLAFPAMIVWRLLSYYSTILIGFIFTSSQHKADRKKNSENQLTE